MRILHFAMALALLAQMAPLSAQGNDKTKVKKRCEGDSLNNEQALGRIDWTLHCASADVNQV